MRWPWGKDTAEALRKGEIIRQLHWQCWREGAPPLETPLADLVEVLPVLIESGSVGLVWPRLWHRAEELGAVGAALATAYESQVAHNARVERDIARVVTRLREHGVEPVLIKGLAVARLYPTPLVRPAGDIDFVVAHADYQLARIVLETPDGDFKGVRLAFHADPKSEDIRLLPNGATPEIDVDLHDVTKWYGAAGHDFFTKANGVHLGDGEVHVASHEDHVRITALHFMRPGALHPRRLLDLSLLVELGAGRLDWSQILCGTIRDIELISVALSLSTEVVGLQRSALPSEVQRRHIPSWLKEDVTDQWSTLTFKPGPALAEIRQNPRSLPSTVRRRWPSPTTATLRTGTRFSNFPRLPIQWAAFAGQISYYLRHTYLRQAATLRK